MSVFPHGPVFRPTSTQKFSRCPMKWWLEDIEGWQPPLDTWSPERDMGTALHAGMAAYWLHLPDPVTQAVNTLADLWPTEASEEYSKDGMLELVGKVAGKLIAYLQRELGHATPILIEQPVGEDGHTTPDVVTREPDVVVTDLKYHHMVQPDRINARFEHLERDHQFQMYPWRVAEYLHEPVRRFRKLGVIGLPKVVIRAETFEIDPVQQAFWLEGARRKWHEMDRMLKGGRGFVYQRAEGCRPFGDKYPCPMEQACWTCYGDREQMTKFYTRKESV